MFCLLNFYLLPLCEDVRKIPPIGHCCWESAVVARVVRRCSYRAFFLLPGEPGKFVMGRGARARHMQTQTAPCTPRKAALDERTAIIHIGTYYCTLHSSAIGPTIL